MHDGPGEQTATLRALILGLAGDVLGGDLFIAIEDAVFSDSTGDVGEVEPDFDAAEVRPFGANGRGDASTKMAGRADVPRDLRMNFAELRDLVHRGLEDFFLGVETSAHRPLVEQMEERAGFVKTNGFGVGKNVKSNFEGDTSIEELILGRPRIVHGTFVSFFGARIRGEKHGRDVVGLAGVGERQQRA